MPRYRTISRWRDRESGEYIDPPAEVVLGEEAGNCLERAGCLKPLPETPNTESSPLRNAPRAFRVDSPGDYPKQVGGGWWEIPGGRKVRGKQAALDAMNDD